MASGVLYVGDRPTGVMLRVRRKEEVLMCMQLFEDLRLSDSQPSPGLNKLTDKAGKDQ